VNKLDNKTKALNRKVVYRKATEIECHRLKAFFARIWTKCIWEL